MNAKIRNSITENTWVPLGIMVGCCVFVFSVGVFATTISEKQRVHDEEIIKIKAELDRRGEILGGFREDLAVIKNDLKYIKKAVTPE